MFSILFVFIVVVSLILIFSVPIVSQLHACDMLFLLIIRNLWWILIRLESFSYMPVTCFVNPSSPLYQKVLLQCLQL